MNEQDIADVLQIQDESGLSFWKFEDYAKEIANEDSFCLIARSENKIVIGFAVVKLLIGEVENKDDSTIYNSSEIYNIAVKSEFQKRGVGQKIFDEIIEKLKNENILEIWLEVRESNEKARKFYRNNGFAEQFVRKNYYNDPLENAHILKLKLDYEDQN